MYRKVAQGWFFRTERLVKTQSCTVQDTVPGGFAPNPFPPLDVSPSDRFAPGRFAPTGRFAPWTFRPQILIGGGGGGG